MAVIRTVFGDDPDMIMDEFLGALDENLERSHGGRTIDMTVFLGLALTEYHQTRPQEEDSPYVRRGPSASMPRDDFEEQPRNRNSASQPRTKATNEARNYNAEKALFEAMAQHGHVPSSKRGASEGRDEAERSLERQEKQPMYESQDYPSSPSVRRRSRGSPDVFSFSVSPTSTEASVSPNPMDRERGTYGRRSMSPIDDHNEPAPDEVMMQIIIDLRACLIEDTQDYLDAIMHAAVGLPSRVITEIREEVETRLQARVASTLSDVLQACQDARSPELVNGEHIKAKVHEMIAKVLQAAEEGGAWDGDSMPEEEVKEAELLSQQYSSLLQAQLQELTAAQQNIEEDEWRFVLSGFSRALLGSPEIRREVEPLVAFLVIFAKSQDEANYQ